VPSTNRFGRVHERKNAASQIVQPTNTLRLLEASRVAAESGERSRPQSSCGRFCRDVGPTVVVALADADCPMPSLWYGCIPQ
jgi:hypothetical protein